MPDVDAALTIGDVSFQDYGLPFLDLGSEWKDFTGKPFVYAVWVCRKEDSRREGIQKVLMEEIEETYDRVYNLVMTMTFNSSVPSKGQ